MRSALRSRDVAYAACLDTDIQVLHEVPPGSGEAPRKVVCGSRNRRFGTRTYFSHLQSPGWLQVSCRRVDNDRKQRRNRGHLAPVGHKRPLAERRTRTPSARGSQTIAGPGEVGPPCAGGSQTIAGPGERAPPDAGGHKRPLIADHRPAPIGTPDRQQAGQLDQDTGRAVIRRLPARAECPPRPQPLPCHRPGCRRAAGRRGSRH